MLGHVVHADEFSLPENTEKSTTTPMDPHQAAATAKLPPGFKLSLIAAEPDIQNPIAFTMDERGRLWVAENYSWAGSGAGGFDGNVRDRIVILEDTDGDGTFEKRTVFWDEARKLTSIEVGNGGVWVLCVPHLLFLPDRNRDDVPDSEPIVVLDGFNEGQIGHTPVNGLKWGPDGWLYGRHGILATSHVGKPGASVSQRFPINTGVWRYHPVRDVAEPVMHGMTNSWGFDFDQHGEMFVINTVIGHLWHVVAGAHTERMFGLDMNPHSYQLISQVADHVHWDTGEGWSDVRKGVTDGTSAAGGGHAHIGLMIYQGDNWPEEYRNQLYTLNLHGRRINADHLIRKGAGYSATHGKDMCFMDDPWYRGMDLLTGPDGGVFIIDWSDTGECHDHDGVHRSSGRLYKLTHGEPAALAPFDLARRSNEDLINLLAHRNTWWARQARRLLTERAHAEGAAENDVNALRHTLQQRLAATTDPITRLRLLEAIATVGGPTPEWWMERLNAENEYERSTALKFLVDLTTRENQSPSPAVLDRLAQLAEQAPSGIVQLHLASTLQRLTIEQRWAIANHLASRTEFAADRMLPLMVWYGIEPAVPHDPQRALLLAQTSAMPQLTEFISRRLTLEIQRDPATCDRLLVLLLEGKIPFPERVISGMSKALNGWQKAKAPAKWSEVAMAFAKADNEETRQQIQGLNVVFGDGRALDELRGIVADKDQPAETRRQALRALLVSRPENYVQTLDDLLDHPGMVVDAIRGLALYDDPSVPGRMLDHTRVFSPAERLEMIQTLTSRPSYARALLKAIRDGVLPSSELSAFHARQIASFGQEDLTKELTELWGDVRVSAAEKRAQIEEQKALLPPDVIEQADLSAGRAIFQKTCANCHVLYGAGRRLGPDLTGSNRRNIDYLLENIVDPSASVGADFRTVVILLDDGRVLNGVVSEQSERTLTLQSPQESITIDRNQIEEMKTTSVSLMPEGQLQKLSPEQIRDLFGYLMGTTQVALPPE